MRNVVVLHGKPSRERYEDPSIPNPPDAHWLPWLRSELSDAGLPVDIPALPEPYSPNYTKWAEVFDDCEVDEHTAVVGHSAGAEFALRWFSEHPRELERLVLVAPWRDTKRKYGEFSNYRVNPDISRRIGRITIFNSLDDSEAIQNYVRVLLATIPGVHYVELDGYGHFMLGKNMDRPEFPALLEELSR